MKVILVPTDYSQDAHETLLFAIEVALRTDAQIVLLHAFYQPLTFPIGENYPTAVNELETQVTQQLRAYAAEVKRSLFNRFSVYFQSTRTMNVIEEESLPKTKSGYHTVHPDQEPARKAAIPIKCTGKFGEPVDEILKAIQVHSADLVLMGMRGENVLGSYLLGRTAVQVLRKAPVPILVVPLGTRFKGFNTIVFAADLIKLSPETKLNTLQLFTQLFHSHLKVLHIYKEQRLEVEGLITYAGLEALERQLPDIHFDVTMLNQHDVVTGVLHFVLEFKADLLVLIPQKHPFLELFLNKSVTRRLAVKTVVPILSLPAGKLKETRSRQSG